MKIRLVGAEFFHADRRTDKHDEANSRFSVPYERAQKQKLLVRCGAIGGEAFIVGRNSLNTYMTTQCSEQRALSGFVGSFVLPLTHTGEVSSWPSFCEARCPDFPNRSRWWQLLP